MYRQKIVDVDAVNLMSAAGLICAAVLSHQRRRKYIETMREFNTLGPINPQYHYHVNRVAVKAALREKVEKGRYMTLNAARQTGKTTLFCELIEEPEATGDYFGILLDFEQLADFSGERFYERLSQTLNRWQQSEKPVATEIYCTVFCWWACAISQRYWPGHSHHST